MSLRAWFEPSDEPLGEGVEAFERAWLEVAERGLERTSPSRIADPLSAAKPLDNPGHVGRPDCRCAWCNHCRTSHLPLACRVLDCRCLQFI